MVDEYFPELSVMDDLNILDSRLGLYNVRIVHNKNVESNYQWVYTYFDDGKLRDFHSYDLRLLRKKVLDKGLDWIVLDNGLAIDAYKLNNDLIAERNKSIHSKGYCVKSHGLSGVNFVSMSNNYWVYNNNGLCFKERRLSDLKRIVLENDGYWIIKDNVVYQDNLLKEKE